MVTFVNISGMQVSDCFQLTTPLSCHIVLILLIFIIHSILTSLLFIREIIHWS